VSSVDTLRDVVDIASDSCQQTTPDSTQPMPHS
jgi:hypothetical protein